MRLGFLGGAIFATWLTLTYPSEMATAFEKLTSVVKQFIDEKPKMVEPPTAEWYTANRSRIIVGLIQVNTLNLSGSYNVTD